MAKKILINEAEFDALDYLPHLAVMIYFKAIRPYMDYATGITGLKRGISLRQFAEETEVQTQRGRHTSKSGMVSKDSLRNAVQCLENAGLLLKLPADKKLVFKLPLASTNSSNSTMNPTSAPQTNPTSTPQAEAAELQAFDEFRNEMNPIPKPPMNPTHQDSGKNIITTTTNYNLNTNTQKPVKQVVSGGGDFVLIFDKRLSETEKRAISNAIPTDNEETAQALVDELAGVMQTQEIKSNVSYFHGIVRRFNSGEFIPTAGIAIAERRANNEKQRVEARQRHDEMTKPKAERASGEKTAAGREAMKALTRKGRK